ncbi:MAG: hypothetical protein KUG56_06335, partial [Kordiimonadaceae bacterium]|nr:hypothetical protein [Kordiimonadaceae bacterium]
VECSHLPVSRTLKHIGVSRPTFYRWYDDEQASPLCTAERASSRVFITNGRKNGGNCINIDR